MLNDCCEKDRRQKKTRNAERLINIEKAETDWLKKTKQNVRMNVERLE